eukprot:768473-Hanusia_phi.AAC.25
MAKRGPCSAAWLTVAACSMLIQESQTEKSPSALILQTGLKCSTRLRLRGGGIFDCFGCKRRVDDTNLTCIELIVHFEAREGSEVLYTPAVIGSGDILGKWDIRKALLMTKGPGELRWSKKISVPREDESYEFKYILIPDRSCAGSEGVLEEVLWEDGPNRAFSTTSNGQIEISSASQLPHHIRHEINGAPPCVDVCFSVHHKTDSASEYISVVGSCEALGNWDPSKAVRLQKGDCDKLGRTRWEVRVSLLCDLSLISINDHLRGRFLFRSLTELSSSFSSLTARRRRKPSGRQGPTEFAGEAIVDLSISDLRSNR